MGNTMASQSAAANPSASSRGLLPWLVSVAFFMESLDTTILNTFFIPNTHTSPTEMIAGIHKAFIALGILTLVSTIAFRSLKSGDCDDVSQHKVLHPGG